MSNGFMIFLNVIGFVLTLLCLITGFLGVVVHSKRLYKRSDGASLPEDVFRCFLLSLVSFITLGFMVFNLIELIGA